MIIKNIFVPEKIGSYAIFSQRILGFDIGKTDIHVTQLLIKGKKITVEKNLEIALAPGNTTDYDERAIAGIAQALATVDKYDAIYTSLSSSVAIFKELKLPFLDAQKIKLIIDFEAEPLLPFPVADAVVDFIITKQHNEEKSSEILIAAVQKQHIAHHLHLFEQAGANPALVTIDLFALYGAYKLIPAYTEIPGGVVLVDIGSYTTGIAYIYNGQLRLIRSLQKGIMTQAKSISHTLNIQPAEAMEQIIRFGLDKNNEQHYAQAAQTAFTDFWQDIAFTLNSFTAQTEQQQAISQIFILGSGADVKGLPYFVTTMLGIPCQPFQIHKLLQNSSLGFTTHNGIPFANIMSLCTALPTPTTASFTLRRKEFNVGTDKSLLNKQLIVGGFLTLLFLLLLGQHDFFQTRALSKSADEAEQETVELLKKQFRKIPEGDTNLESVVRQAESEVQKEEKLWFAFANPNRISFLQYLLELTSIINKDELGFTIDRLHITSNTITLDAHVKDHDALKALEKELRKSKLFKKVEPSNDPDFKMKIKLA